METNILLFGTMGDIGPTVRSSLMRHGYSVQLVEFAQNTLRDEPGYKRELLKAVRQFQPGMIVPIGNQTAMARLKDSLPDGIYVPVESAAKVEMLDSKVACSRLARELGILQPMMYDHAASVPHFPVIFKRDRSFGGSGVLRPKSREALERLIAKEPGMPYLIEELIEGTDYSVDAVRKGNSFMASCYKSLSSQGQGPSSMREVVQNDELCAIARKLLDHIDYNGVCGMDFRIGADGRAYFLECNPRFTGGIATQIDAGFDISYLLLTL